MNGTTSTGYYEEVFYDLRGNSLHNSTQIGNSSLYRGTCPIKRSDVLARTSSAVYTYHDNTYEYN